MIILWAIYTRVHGPTSFDRMGSVLGRSTLFWGSLLGGVPNLLLVGGLLLMSQTLIGHTRTVSKIGFFLTLFGLLIPAGVDLIAGGLGPPLFVPVVGTGLALVALGNWRNPQLGQGRVYLLLLMGVLQLIAFTWVFIPQDLYDQIYGYRIYGVLANVLEGIGWIALGFSTILEQTP